MSWVKRYIDGAVLPMVKSLGYTFKTKKQSCASGRILKIHNVKNRSSIFVCNQQLRNLLMGVAAVITLCATTLIAPLVSADTYIWRQTVGTPVEPVIPAPTVKTVQWVGGNVTVRGTYSSVNTKQLRVFLNNKWFVLGIDSELTANGDDWTLDIAFGSSYILQVGEYDIIAEATTPDGKILLDTTRNEVSVLPITVENIVSHPTTNVLAKTGTSLWIIIASAVLLIFTALILFIVMLRRKKRGKT